jgi:hypothetical protein
MSHRAEKKRDAFTFSLGGLTTIAAFVPAPAVAHDRIRMSRGSQECGAAAEAGDALQVPENRQEKAA